ncbi:MAG: GTP cyclohydrolase II [Pseudomonadota bacterium]
MTVFIGNRTERQMQAIPAKERLEDAAILRNVERALAEVRRGAPLILLARDGHAALAVPAEAVTDNILTQFRDLSGTNPVLLITPERAAAIGVLSAQGKTGADQILALSLADLDAKAIGPLADPVPPNMPAEFNLVRDPLPLSLTQGAIDLAKLARLLPAAVIAPLQAQSPDSLRQWSENHGLLWVWADDVTHYGLAAAHQLVRVAEARIPLEGAEDTRVIAFRPSDGGVEHLAIVVGRPKPENPLLVRLHSECFTGDLLGSLRCDCGDQLRGAIEAIGKEGAGILLYLNQEGRGIGLVNKLRAYQLQDLGADTLEANETLGFGADERIYKPAAEMLRQLGFDRIRLLTNNPEKVGGLTDWGQSWGLTVVERVPHSFPSNGHNDFYLATKASRFGHLF